MLQTLKILQKENVVNIKELQKGPSRHLQGITRVLRGGATYGYFMNQEIFDSLIEDLEAISSPNFRNSIAQSRKSKQTLTLKQVEAKYGLK